MKYLFPFLLLFLIPIGARCQNIGIKTNLLYDATATMSLAAEIRLTGHSSLELGVNYNPWEFSDNKMHKIIMFQPEYRYWLCETMNGHFFGLHAHGGEFNFNKINLPFGLYPNAAKFNYQGEFYGAGVSYGYQWILSNRWAFELTIGAGYAHINYSKYPSTMCGAALSTGNKNYWGITKVGISFMYIIF